jgi:hypothetical protein
VITPPLSYSGSSSLLHTYNLPEEWYLIQTPSGGILLGGGLEEMERGGRLGRLGDEDDSFVDEEWTKSEAVASRPYCRWSVLLRRVFVVAPHSHSRLQYCPSHFKCWGPEGYGEGLTRVWSGIPSAVKDFLPVVGKFRIAMGCPLPPGGWSERDRERTSSR